VSAVYCRMAPRDPVHGPYHDTEYGFPTDEESVLYERLMLEINQAGLSWATILKKRAAFRAAFADFAVDRDPGIIRNRLKIEAATENARRVQALRHSHGSFALWLAAHHPRSAEEWTKLFRQTFRFTGGQIVGEFLMSVGYLPGAHEPDCPVFARIRELSPPWARAAEPRPLSE
jgi:DNA-3-methyladenine glycosylase I